MSEFTLKGFSKLFEIKGYDELAQFFSTSFYFTDKIEAGLLRVQNEFVVQAGENRFRLSAYPVWEDQGKPYVSSYISCLYTEGKFSIKSLDLSFCEGTYNGQIHSRTLQNPRLNDIPDKVQMNRELKKFTQTQDNVVNQRNIKKFKL